MLINMFVEIICVKYSFQSGAVYHGWACTVVLLRNKVVILLARRQHNVRKGMQQVFSLLIHVILDTLFLLP